MRRVDRVLSACLVASGAAGLIYEVLWLRQLALVMGNTVYALSAVLTAFLGGLALGAFLGGRWTERYGASLRLYVAIELCIAGSALLMPWLIRSLGPVFGLAYRGLGDAFVTYNLVQFALCGLLLLVPTSFMGATLPVVTAVLVRNKRDIAIDVGRLYALNSMGGVVGAGVAGFALLPWLGMFGTGLAAVGINVAVAAAANWLPRSESPLLTKEGARGRFSKAGECNPRLPVGRLRRRRCWCCCTASPALPR
jgi:spermidine synthase